MDSETRHLDAARAPGAPPVAPPVPAPANAGNPTAYLPPLGAAPPAGSPNPAPPAGNYPPPAPTYTAPQAGGYTVPQAGPYTAPQAGGYTVPQPGPYTVPQAGGYAPPQTGAYTAPQAGGYAPPQAGPYTAPGAPPPGQRYAPPPAPWGPMSRRGGRQGIMWPLVLLGLGLFVFSGRFSHVFGAAIPLALGLIFLYVSRQGPGRFGFRIPGAILTGLGVGIVLDAADLGNGGYSALGLGLGFIALWVMDRTQWWWLIPGAIISLGGLEGVMSSSGWSGSVVFPLALVAFGAYLLSGRSWRTRA